MRAISIAIALMLTGCVESWSPVEATSVKEMFVVAETSRFAKLHNWNVRGEISAEVYLVQNGQYGCENTLGCVAAGWYASGIAFFYQDWVNRESTTDQILTATANHEVCHHDFPQHDSSHWKCMQQFGAATYPQPNAGSVWTGPAFVSIGVTDGHPCRVN